jgi:valyl-tRNA synthetase
MNTPVPPVTPALLPVEDRWILSRLNDLVRDTTEKIDAHEIGMATGKVVDFVWDEFCDWYVEMVKPRLRDEATKGLAMDILVRVLTVCLKLLHPVVPFITEDLFLALDGDEARKLETIMRAAWPEHDPALADAAAEKDVEALKEVVRGIRNIRAERQVPAGQKISLLIQPEDETAEMLFVQAKAYVMLLCGAADIVIDKEVKSTDSGMISLVVPGATVYLPLASLIDTEKEHARLTKEQKRLTSELARIDGKLNNEGYLAKAPAELVNTERDKRVQFAQMLAKVENELKGMV